MVFQCPTLIPNCYREFRKLERYLDRFDADVRYSQASRWVVYETLRNGDHYPWDYQPLQKVSERYMRNHMDLNVPEETRNFPEESRSRTMNGSVRPRGSIGHRRDGRPFHYCADFRRSEDRSQMTFQFLPR